MAYWWVNQNQTSDYEIDGGFLWSPKKRRDGGRNQFYDNMKLVRKGDIIFSYYSQRVRHVGTADGPAVTEKKPVNFGMLDQWDPDGWRVPVIWDGTPHELDPRGIIDDLRPYLPRKYSPLRQDGKGLQGVYLAAVP